MSRTSLSALLLLTATLAMAGCTEKLDSTGADVDPVSGKGMKPGAAPATMTTSLLRTDKQAFEGMILVGTQDAAGAATGCGDVGQDMVDQMTFDWVVVDKEADGTPSEVRRALIKLAATTPTSLDIDLFVVGPGGQEVGSGTSGDPAETLELKTTLKAGTYQLLVTGCNLAAMQFTLDAEADYYAV
ncbi:MAG TPA: hypothetical protein VGB18_01380 [Candidatus Thermoplasmatota archaeon]